jgi:hypothetical protein
VVFNTFTVVKLIQFISLYCSLSLDLKRPVLATNVYSDNSGDVLASKSATATKTSASSYTLSSSLDTADTFHTALSPCSVEGEHDVINIATKRPSVRQAETTNARHVAAHVGSDDSDELSSNEDSYLKVAVGGSGIVNSEHSTSSFEKISPPTEIHNNTRQQKSQCMNGKVSKSLAGI